MSDTFKSIASSLAGGNLTGLSVAASDKNDISTAKGNFNKNLGYFFRVVDSLAQFSLSTNIENNPFKLQINPQELNQDEPFAVQITPTQAGILVEHQGNIFKDLIIAGTTGMTPKAGMGGTTDSGETIAFSDQNKAKTGFEEFHNFRNFIRQYQDRKRDIAHKGLVMIFENPKDNEYFIVEPLKFSMKRSSSKKFLYNYEIVFRVLGRLAAAITQEKPTWYQSVQAALIVAKQQIDRGTSFVLAEQDFLRNVSSDVERLVIAPLQSISEGIGAVGSTVNVAINLPRKFVSDTLSAVKQIKTKAVEAANIDISSYNTLFGRTDTTQYKVENTTFDLYQLNNAFTAITRGLSILLSNNQIFGSDSLLDASRPLIDIYDNKISVADTNFSISRTVLQNDTIQSVSARELGDITRFRELIILNHLKPPYIANVRADGVLIPGDIIQIPANVVNPATTGLNVLLNQEYPITSSLSWAEKQMGVDLALSDNWDLIITNLNDFHLLGGKDNAVQALKIKISLERGSLKFHPNLGNPARLGEKYKKDLVYSIKASMMQTILSDPRFDSVSLQATVVGTTININGSVKVKTFDYLIPIDLSVEV